jgi:outer membrane lipoprotein
MRKRFIKIVMRFTYLTALVVGVAGCAAFSSSPFDQSFETQVTAGVSFAQVAQDPSGHIGQIVKVGGEVLSAKRLVNRTEVMVLQMPLNRDSMPTWNRIKSQGRFIATQHTFLDPATLPKGTRLTIIGEVTGQATVQVDAEEKVYPVLAVKALNVWPIIPLSVYGYRPYWGPYWDPWWYYPRSPFYTGFRPFRHHRGRR